MGMPSFTIKISDTKPTLIVHCRRQDPPVELMNHLIQDMPLFAGLCEQNIADTFQSTNDCETQSTDGIYRKNDEYSHQLLVITF